MRPVYFLFAAICLPLFLFWPPKEAPAQTEVFDNQIKTGAEQMHHYLPFLKGKRLGLLVNHSSAIGETHLVDSLLALGLNVKKIFAPEHGFRGTADRGEKILDAKDPKTGLPIVSLYGKNRKAKAAELANLDLVIFDIQDVGVRFYTYSSSMTYMMEACARAKIPFLVLDRPNPLGHYIDGPILEKEQRSFVGLHPVPIVHGLTLAEYARMINEEFWLSDSLQCDLKYVACLNYRHDKYYELPIKPSPNLPNMRSIYLYPGLCLFEGTQFSVGRGTQKQFQCYGHPAFPSRQYSFKPVPMPGAKSPVQNQQLCWGEDLSLISLDSLQAQKQIPLQYFLKAYKEAPSNLKQKFFSQKAFFDKLVGNSWLRTAIQKGENEEQIRARWAKELEDYKVLRQKYLLYP
ncbi:hypothetical protein SapgrDRAFT_0564 [Saprospira grandis DSM 2844]|uniref:DUF1343 domain-containing protein n=1 Tax=Saprospira grandis DSM 2844 TaxID=694433 RepID=J0P4F4_9BACT|nr:DUF1343 domain-containing protein [Saprospira grandis]EJF52307.1 hypothetical protein SapgrDRAFT_0564 [Saprospira grandis DSM 2844]